MTSNDYSQTPAGASLLLTLTVPSFLGIEPANGKKRMMPCVPSWNQVTGLQVWGRAKLKKQIQDAFLSALRASAESCSIKTTSAKNTLLIAADTLASYQATVRAKQKSRSDKKRQEKKRSAP